MKALVVYDSAYGNTQSKAEAISGSLEGLQASSIPVGDFKPGEPGSGDLLVVGSPINGWRPTPKVTAVLSALGKDSLQGVKAAAFDTRLRMFIHGDAAGKIARALKAGGADIIADPMPFYIRGSEGPLRDGEIEKAEGWARTLLASVTS